MATAKTAHAMFNVQFECSICQELFTDPCMLPCEHTFCLECIQKHVAAVACEAYRGIDKVPCPLCRSKFAVGSHNLRDLPISFTAAALILSLPDHGQCALVDDGDGLHD